MAGRIEAVFFFIHKQFEKLNSVFKSKKVSLIVAPLLPFSVAILCVVQISNNTFIIFNSIILCLAIIFTFLLTVSSTYFLKGDNIFNRYNREKSNSNLSQFQIGEMSLDIVNEKKVLEILESNKDEISHYYFQLRNIEVFEFDTSLDDFKNLITNEEKLLLVLDNRRVIKFSSNLEFINAQISFDLFNLIFLSNYILANY